MMKKLLSWVLSLAMIVSLMPAAVFAEGEKDPDVVFTKELIPSTDDQPDRLRLEAYTTGAVSTSTKSVPTDIVLVLDQSGSMAGSNLTTLKSAVTSFVSEVAELNEYVDTGNEHRISIVGFASESGYGENTEILTATIEDNETHYKYVYEEVTGDLDTSKENYYIQRGEDYRQLFYRNGGWYIRNGRNYQQIDIRETYVYERTRQAITITSTTYGIPYADLLDQDDDLEEDAVYEKSLWVADNNDFEAVIKNLAAEGATRTDLGMELAEKILSESERDSQIVVLLTDGVPTSWTDFDEDVANGAVEIAKGLKDDGVHIFSMYLGNPSSASANFLQAVSSNYPKATSIDEDDMGDRAASSYYAAHSSSIGIKTMFTQIVSSINANSTLNESAVVADELTEYFRLPNGTYDPEQIQVFTSDYQGGGEWSAEVPFDTASVDISNDGKTISVTNFNFAYHCVTETPKQSGGSDYGRKLVIYIPIVEDEDADTFGGYLPTNEDAGIFQGAESDEPIITAKGAHSDVTIRYSLSETQRSYHIGEKQFYTIAYTSTYMNPILDDMITSIPNGTNNEGVKMDYVLLDAGMYDKDVSTDGDKEDDVILARLTVPAGNPVDPTDLSNWTLTEEAEAGAVINVDPNLHFGEKLYVLACTLTSVSPEVEEEDRDSLFTYAILAIDVINEANRYNVYATMDYGGVLSVEPKGAPGTLITNTYTESVESGGSSAKMIFAPDIDDGYEIATITIDQEVVYDVTDSATYKNVEFDNGVYTYQAENVQKDTQIVVTTHLRQFELITEHDSGSSIRENTTYAYHATDKLDVYFSAHTGYQITELFVSNDSYTGIGADDDVYEMSDEELADLGIDHYDTYDEIVSIATHAADDSTDGMITAASVFVPRTRDNFVAVASTANTYDVTYKYYKYENGTYELLGAMTEGPKRVAYASLIPKPRYDAGDTVVLTEGGEAVNYTLSEWHLDPEFNEISDVSTMPAHNLTLHAYLTKAPDVNYTIQVEKIVDAPYTEAASTFTFEAKLYQDNVGSAEITIPQTITDKDEFQEELTLTLTDAEDDAFRAGNAKIYIHEALPSQNQGIWRYDSTVYELHYENGSVVAYKSGSSEPVENIIFHNTLISSPVLTVEKRIAAVGETTIEYNQDGTLKTTIPAVTEDTVITWTITVTNSGAAAGKISLADVLTNINEQDDAEHDVVIADTDITKVGDYYVVPAKSGDADGVITFTATYTVTNADAGGRLVNKVTVTDTEDPDDPPKVDEADPIDVAPYTVTYVDGVEEKAFKTQNYPEQTYGVKTPAFDGNGEEEGTPLPEYYMDGDDKYIFVGWEPEVAQTVTGHATYVAQWEKDNLDDEDDKPTGGDGIPDKYQAVVTYKVVNGTWDGINAEPIVKVFTLKEKNNDGDWDDANPMPTLGDMPTGMKPAAGYQNTGKWDKEHKAADTPVDGTIYTFTFNSNEPNLTVTKTVSKASVEVGDTITYTITVTNTGDVALTNVTVTDDFIEGGDKDRTWTIDTLAVGESKVFTVNYKTVNADRNGLKNVAVADSNETDPKTTPTVDVDVDREPIIPVGPSKPQLNLEDHYAYIVGYPDGLVHPERNITRAEVATIFFRMLLDESREYFWSQINAFNDVPADQWYNNAVSTLANADLITGYPNGSYKPNANITRAEFATIAIRFFLDEDVEIEKNNLSDVKDHWAEANINLAYALDLITGYPDGTFRPDQLITRAEAMTIVNRVLKRAPHEDHLLEDMIVWPDNMDEDAWYYEAVQEATNSHEFHMLRDKNEDENYENWTELLPVRDWVALEREWSEHNSSRNPGEVVDINITTPEAGDEDGSLKLD